MRMVFAAACTLFLGSASSWAQEVPAAKWQGAYFGGEAGESFGHGEVININTQQTNTASGNHLMAGAFGGSNWRSGPYVLGAEADWSRIVDGSSDDLFTLRGRAGYAFGNSLLYATAGVGTESRYVERLATSDRVYHQHLGYAVGAGYEMMLPNNFSFRGEGIYFGADKQQYDFGPSGVYGPASFSFDFNKAIFRAGPSYHLN